MSQSEILIQDLSVTFRLYHGGARSLKEAFASIFRPSKIASYSDFSAVNHVSLHIRSGERVGIIGHNGAGKSTLLKTLCRIYEPTKGTVRVKGRIAPLLEIGAGFHPEFTGRENIYLNGAILGYAHKELQAIEAEVVAFAELEEFIDTPVKYYSTGMYMRLAFALATAMHPEIMVLDELFAGGDAAFIEKAKKRMYEMIDRSHIMVTVSHDASLIRSLCNRCIWMDRGQIIADGPTDEILDRYLAAAHDSVAG